MSGIILLVLRIGLAASLYAFLGWVVYTLWRELQQQSSQIAARRPTPIQLVRQAGAEPAYKRFSEGRLIIGRDPSCDYILSDGTVSAHHARLTFRQGQWWLEDLRSTNGTFVNGEQVDTPMVVTDGDELRCGQIAFSISINPSAQE